MVAARCPQDGGRGESPGPRRAEEGSAVGVAFGEWDQSSCISWGGRCKRWGADSFNCGRQALNKISLEKVFRLCLSCAHDFLDNVLPKNDKTKIKAWILGISFRKGSGLTGNLALREQGAFSTQTPAHAASFLSLGRVENHHISLRDCHDRR